MPAVAFGTPDQVEFLESQLSAFQQAQRTKTLAVFWPDVQHEFFRRWRSSEDELPEVTVPTKRQSKSAQRPKEVFTNQAEWETTRRAQITHWFNNRRVNKKTSGNSQRKSDEPEIGRVSSEINIYSRKYYDQRVKPIADPQLVGAPEKAHLAIRNRCIIEAWKNETPEIKAEVLAEREQEIKAKEEAKAAVDKPWTLEGCATALLEMPQKLQTFLENQAKRTEWCFTLIGGGPDPTFGKMRTFAVHIGQDTFGSSFKNSHPNYQAHIYEPFLKFLNEVYPPAEIARRTLRKESADDGAIPSSSNVAHAVGEESLPNASPGAELKTSPEPPSPTPLPSLGGNDVSACSVPATVEGAQTTTLGSVLYQHASPDALSSMPPPQLTLGSINELGASASSLDAISATPPALKTHQAPQIPPMFLGLPVNPILGAESLTNVQNISNLAQVPWTSALPPPQLTLDAESLSQNMSYRGIPPMFSELPPHPTLGAGSLANVQNMSDLAQVSLSSALPPHQLTLDAQSFVDTQNLSSLGVWQNQSNGWEDQQERSFLDQLLRDPNFDELRGSVELAGTLQMDCGKQMPLTTPSLSPTTMNTVPPQASYHAMSGFSNGGMHGVSAPTFSTLPTNASNGSSGGMPTAGTFHFQGFTPAATEELSSTSTPSQAPQGYMPTPAIVTSAQVASQTFTTGQPMMAPAPMSPAAQAPPSIAD
ncbi:hypothetical protein NLJ89_g11525 [Agrocybe chaxingu]|uniref:Uncharacterized protein n=1 Tax=Agrocybe chaxingu TaxID=84603 RepID=A0A9W8JPV4_9AGAR|nr:hypothetical protein NLJ89_g11525 [Agrocybe chaxingu]